MARLVGTLPRAAFGCSSASQYCRDGLLVRHPELPQLPIPPAQVYLAEWSATLVAVKVLLGAGGLLGSAGDVQRALSQSAPLLRKLESEASLLASLRWAKVGVLHGDLAWAAQADNECHHGKMILRLSRPLSLLPLPVANHSSSLPAQPLHHLPLPTPPANHARHPNVVHFLGICHEPPCIVTEFCARGSLAQVHASSSSSSDCTCTVLVWLQTAEVPLALPAQRACPGRPSYDASHTGAGGRARGPCPGRPSHLAPPPDHGG